jgi:hypothetical protein
MGSSHSSDINKRYIYRGLITYKENGLERWLIPHKHVNHIKNKNNIFRLSPNLSNDIITNIIKVSNVRLGIIYDNRGNIYKIITYHARTKKPTSIIDLELYW